VILATDADVDGLHIRNLLITYFFRFFEQLVHDGHLFVLERRSFAPEIKSNDLLLFRNRTERSDCKAWQDLRDHPF